MTKERTHPLNPFRVEKFKNGGDNISVEALGTALPAPGIQITRYSYTRLNRVRTEIIAFEPEDVPRLIQYLEEATRHWKGEA